MCLEHWVPTIKEREEAGKLVRRTTHLHAVLRDAYLSPNIGIKKHLNKGKL